jgi:hypothetical protein
MMRAIALFATLLFAAAVQAGDAAKTYGKPLPKGSALPISEAIAKFDAHAGKPTRYSGRITQVCQAEGCWMVLEHNGQTARVMFGDHAFSIPKDSVGRAEVYGTLSRKDLTPDQVKHLEEDSKGLPVSAVEYRILAQGVVLQGTPPAKKTN